MTSIPSIAANQTFAHSGEIGDVIFALPSIKALGGGRLVGVNRPWTRPNFSVRVLGMKRLLESQDYISSVEPFDEQHIDIDFSPYRTGGQLWGDTIVDRQARWVGAPVDPTIPWLTVDPDPNTKGRIVVARGPRWQGQWFPWGSLVKAFGPDMLFIGLQDEYKDFCERFGAIKHYPTTDLLDVARAIEGSEIFIGSQSSPNAVCEGLKKRNVLEVCLTSLDCIFHRDTTDYVFDGGLEIEILGKRFVSEPFSEGRKIDKMIAPPGGWSVLLNDKIYSSYALTHLINEVRIQHGEVDGIEDRIIAHTKTRVPWLGATGWRDGLWDLVQQTERLIRG